MQLRLFCRAVRTVFYFMIVLHIDTKLYDHSSHNCTIIHQIPSHIRKQALCISLERRMVLDQWSFVVLEVKTPQIEYGKKIRYERKRHGDKLLGQSAIALTRTIYLWILLNIPQFAAAIKICIVLSIYFSPTQNSCKILYYSH